MKHLINLFFLMLLICTFVIPTSAYASTYTNESTSNNNNLFTPIINIFSSFNTGNKTVDNQMSSKNDNNSNYADRNSNDWWNCWLNGFFGGNSGHPSGGNNNQCNDNRWGWGNDKGCLDSAEIWKKWYCS